MSLGVHFALTKDEVEKLRSFTNDTDRLDYVEDELEEYFLETDRAHAAETDKAWDAIHRALTDGRLNAEEHHYPWGHVILSGELLYAHGDYVMSLKTPQQVSDVASVLAALTKAQFRALYFAIPPVDYGSALSESDFEYTWAYLKASVPFWTQAADEGRWVLFTADR